MNTTVSLLLLAACLPPSGICRWQLLHKQSSHGGDPVAAQIPRWRLWLAGTIQDAALAGQLLGLLWVLEVFCLDRRVIGSVAVVGLIAIHHYVLVDGWLHRQLGLRLTFSLLQYAREARSLMSSAEHLGIRRLLVLAALIACADASLVSGIFSYLGLPGASPGSVAIVVAFAAGAALTPRWLPAGALALVGNPLLLEQFRAWHRVTRRVPRPVDRAPEAAPEPFQIPPPTEVADPPDPDFPLFRKTREFAGPTQFEFCLGQNRRPHVIVLLLESFRGLDVGVLGGRHGVSPVFDRLAREGVLFTDCYANGVQTARAMEAVLFGLIPRFRARPIQTDPGSLRLVGLADILGGQGYRCAYIHGGESSFQDQDAFFMAHGYHEACGMDAVIEAVPGTGKLSSWGVHDEYLFKFVVDRLTGADRAGQPTFNVVLTTTNHHPWPAPAGFRSQSPAGNLPREHRSFLRTFRYTDHCLGQFVEALKQTGLWPNCLLFVLADTGQPMGERDDNFMLLNQLHEEGQRIPLLIIGPGRLRQPAVIREPVSQVDIMPTVMDLLGVTGGHHAMGQSLYRKTVRAPAIMNNPHGVGIWGARAEQWKLLHNVQMNESYLFDLSQDPGETLDVATDHPGIADRLQRRLDAVRHRLDSLYSANRLAPAPRL